jgi:hypothetical protein
MSTTSQMAWKIPRHLYSKQIHKRLRGVYCQEDIFDFVCSRYPHLARLLCWKIDPEMRVKQLIFIHVPCAAEISVMRALFGDHRMAHRSAHFYRAVDPAFFAHAESFAILRDPYERFIFSYSFVRKAGIRGSDLNDVFCSLARDIRSVDEYLDFLEHRNVLSLDFVMRPQTWFVCDRVSGKPLPKRLFVLGRDNAALDAFLQARGSTGMPWLNGSLREPLDLSPVQRWRIKAIYEADFALVRHTQQQRMTEELATRLAAE